MPKLKVLSGNDLIKIFNQFGFAVQSQKGSHVKLYHFVDKTRQVILPLHNKDLTRGMLFSVLKQAKVSVSEFLKLLGKK